MFCHTGGGGGTLQFLRGTALCFISAFSCRCISFSVMPFLFIEYCNAFIPTVDYSENSSFKNLFNIKQISTFFFLSLSWCSSCLFYGCWREMSVNSMAPFLVAVGDEGGRKCLRCAVLFLNYFGGFQDEKICFRVLEGSAWFLHNTNANSSCYFYQIALWYSWRLQNLKL